MNVTKYLNEVITRIPPTLDESKVSVSNGVTIEGDGVAASACARLLGSQDIPILWEPTGRATQPAIMLGLPTLRMLADIFAAKNFAEDFLPVRKRVVLWGQGAAAEIPHAAVVVSEATLLSRLRSLAPSPFSGSVPSAWTIRANRATTHATQEHSFGDRRATAFAVKLDPKAGDETCWIESLDKGWLFLLPEGAGRARLLSVGDLDGDGLSHSRLIASQIESVEDSGRVFPSHPRINDPLCGPGWLACGTAALSFDPVCGEGAGHALREAILANAVICASLAGTDETDLLHHYRSRLIAGFARHLQTCIEFYASGGSTPWWTAQITSLRDGLEWCRIELDRQPPTKFRLQDFALEAT